MRKYKKIIVLGVLIGICLIMMTISSLARGKSNTLKVGGIYLLSPFQKIVSFFSGKVEKFWLNISEMKNIKGEKETLSKKVKCLEEKIRSYEVAVAQNKRLKELLAYKSEVSYKMILAKIIARDAHNWFKTILLDKGKREGITQNMPVVVPEGVIGKVIEVAPHTSKVLLILDKCSGIGGMVERTRNIGVVKGDGAICLLRYLSREAEVKKEDVVISSGLGRIFPQGLVIGKVEKVAKKSNELFQYIEVIPGVNFNKLEEVFIITMR